MRESESIIMQIDIVDSLIHFIKSKYGVRTKAITSYIINCNTYNKGKAYAF